VATAAPDLLIYGQRFEVMALFLSQRHNHGDWEMLLGCSKVARCLEVTSGLGPAQLFVQQFLKQMQRLPVQHVYNKATSTQNT